MEHQGSRRVGPAVQQVVRGGCFATFVLAAALYLPFWVRVCTRIGSMWGGRGGLTWA
jgi:hypothetical protein